LRPNILWFCTDQQRFDTIGALGNPYVSTPTIDSLVDAGMSFTHTYCQSPICTPSRASFLTGMYPSAVHCNRNGNARFPNNYPLVTKLLADAGYRCGLVGKLHLAGAYRRVEPRVDDGYSWFKYSHAPRDDWEEGHDYAEWVRAKGHSLKALSQSLDGVPAELHQTTWAAERSIEFIEAHQGGAENDRPWLLSVNVYDPHPPFNPPRAYRDMVDPATMPGPYYRPSDLEQQRILEPAAFQSKGRPPEDLDIANPIVPKTLLPGGVEEGGGSGGARDAWTLQAAYYAMIKLIDDQLARILEALDRTGQRDNTIIIFTSDHGEALGDHGLIQKGCRFYEGLVRVPLIWVWPGRIPAGVKSDALVELMDKAPTLLDFAGVPIPEHMQAKSLRPILEAEADPMHHRDHVRSEYYDALDLPGCALATMYRQGRYKIVNYHRHDFGELYDLEADPWEFENLWDDPPHRELRCELTRKSFDASMRAIDLGPPRVGPM